MSYNFALSYCFVGLATIAFIWLVLFADLRRERFRCELRRIRDQLFDFMWQNGFDFSDPNYQKARASINGILAESNTMSPTLMFLVLLWATWHRRWKPEPLLDGPIGEQVRLTYYASAWVVIQFAFLSGVPGFVIRLLLSTLLRALQLNMRVRGAGNNLASSLADVLQNVDNWRIGSSLGLAK
jgi:hypothetical protein